MKLAVVTVVMAMCAGCATNHQSVPDAVLIMPDDCANRHAMENWLLRQASVSKSSIQNQHSYEHAQAQIKHRLWNLRYNCSPV